MNTEKGTYRIAVAGCGYVGLSLAVLLSQNCDVTVVDPLREKTDAVNRLESPILDSEITRYFEEAKAGKRTLRLSAVTDGTPVYAEADLIVVAVPTSFDEGLSSFDCSIVEDVLLSVRECSAGRDPLPTVVIRSTVPVGYTDGIREKLGMDNILFSPEYLRESKALYDCLHPSRIVVGTDEASMDRARQFAGLLAEGAETEDIPVLCMPAAEAEAAKLFANTCLALRVSFFNELDTYAETRGLDTASIIRSVCLDPRIGGHYNNPSFGYGGYCLPKDTKQLLAGCAGVPEELFRAVVKSNDTRKKYLADRILSAAGYKDGGPKPVIGIFRLAMKTGSDNFRESAVIGIIRILREKDLPVILYEPLLPDGSEYLGCRVVNDPALFKAEADLIAANRLDPMLDDVRGKVYTRDLFSRD